MEKHHIQPGKSGILIITDELYAGGRERQVVELLKGLRYQKKYKLVLALIDTGGGLQDEGVSLVDVFIPLKRYFRYDISPIFSLLWSVKGLSISVVHTFGWMSGFIGLVTARRLNCPFINGGIRYAPPKLPWREKVSLWTMRFADIIVSNSQAGLRAYGLEPSPDTRVRVIYNGLDMKRFQGIAPAEYPKHTICMVANFSVNKDHKTLIRALPLIRAKIKDVQLIMIGRDLGTMEASQQLVAELGLDSCVYFITNSTEPQPYIAASQMGILTSNIMVHGEGSSNAILEYMAMGKPVIATDCGGNSEVIQNGVTGYIIPPASPKDLADRVIELFDDPIKAKAMGDTGRQRVIEHFSMERMILDYEKLYSGFCG